MAERIDIDWFSPFLKKWNNFCDFKFDPMISLTAMLA